MNKARRREIQKALDLLTEAMGVIETVRDEAYTMIEEASEHAESAME